MHHRVELMLGHQPRQQRLVADVAFDEFRLWRHRPPVSRRQIVEHNYVFRGIGQRQHHVAADVARSARYQNAHARLPNSSHFGHDRFFTAESENPIKNDGEAANTVNQR